MSIPPPPPVIGQAKPKKIQTMITTEVAQKKMPHSAFPFWNQSVDWENIIDFHLSNNENAGVFFIETKDGSHLVIKASSTLANELFGIELARNVGLYAPKVQLLEWDDSPDMNCNRKQGDDSWERRTDWRRCQIALTERNVKAHDLGKKRKAAKELDRAFFIMMECVVPSSNLNDLPEYCAEKKLNVREIICNKSFLVDIGKLVVMDILLNNSDRIPVGDLWDNAGNPGNVLISFANVDNLRVAAIDQACVPILNDQKRNVYLERVAEFSKEMKNNSSENKYLDSICTFLETSVGLTDPIVNERKYIAQGIYECLQILCQFSLDSLEELKHQIDKMKKGEDWANVWQLSMATIHIDFLFDVLVAMR
jgi:hypothetical protein